MDRRDRTRAGTRERGHNEEQGDASLVTVLSLLLNRGNETTAPGMSVSHRSIQTSRYKSHPLSRFTFFLCSLSLSSSSLSCPFSRFPLFFFSRFSLPRGIDSVQNYSLRLALSFSHSLLVPLRLCLMWFYRFEKSTADSALNYRVAPCTRP